ncbi:uncharacterized protein [Anabrus simplex]|uniref:uncharacterized protein n=1 Tax=Anabrus simplex TaxID=316456 RepID=UPI0035A2837F
MMKFALVILATIGLACGSVLRPQPRDIHQDIQDFLALIPTQEILNILFDHLANDAEFQDGVAYLQSDEFKQALTVVEGKQELKALLDDLEGYDLRAYEFMNTINGLVGIPPIQPKHSRHTRSVKEIVDEIRAVLPKEEIKALYDEKMQNSPDFNKVITHLQSAEFKQIVDTFRSVPEEQVLERKLEEYGITVDEIINLQIVDTFRSVPEEQVLERKLEEYGITVDEIINLVKDFLDCADKKRYKSRGRSIGSQFHLVRRVKQTYTMKFALVILATISLACGSVLRPEPRDIHQDIQDFLALIPTQDILNILFDHLANDAEFQDGVAYLQSDEFKQALTVVEGKQELKALLDDLEGYDLRAYEFMNTINGLVGIPPIQPKHSRHARSVKEIVDEIRAVLPKEEIKALYDEKMQNSPDFNRVITHLQSAEFKQIVDTFRSVPEEQVLERKLEEYGITVDEIINLVKDFLGSWSDRSRGSQFHLVRRLKHIYTMKFAIVILATIGLACGSVLRPEPRDIHQDIQDFLALIPTQDILNILFDHLANDAEFQDSVAYLQSDEFKQALTVVEGKQELKALLDDLEGYDLRAYEFMNTINGLVGIPPIQPKHSRHARSVKEIVDEIRAVLPKEEIKALYDEKMQNSPDFNRVITHLQSAEFKQIVDTFRSVPEEQVLERKLEEYGITVDEIINLKWNKTAAEEEEVLVTRVKQTYTMKFALVIFVTIGLTCGSVLRPEPRDIHQDIQDFLALIPNQDILDIIFDHLANDAEFQDVVAFLQSVEFKKALAIVEGKQEFKAILDDLESYDLRAYDFINNINGPGPFFPPIHPEHPRHARSVNDMLEEIRAVLPKDKIKALYDKKMQNSPDFNKVITHLQSAEFKKIVDTFRSVPEEQVLERKLEEYGITVDEIINLVKDCFDCADKKRYKSRGRSRGSQFHLFRRVKQIYMMKFALVILATIGLACGSVLRPEPRDIHQDIQDFLALIPTQDILNILFDHLANDAEFQDGVAYLQSDEFKQALTVVEGKQELKALLDDLEGYDLRAYEFMNTINGLVGIPPIQPKHSRRTRSVKEIVDEIRAVLPKEEIKALYDEKMQNSPDFNKVITHLQSAEFKQIVDTFRSVPEEQVLERKLEEYGITVDEIINLVKDFLDESRFPLTQRDARQHVWRYRGDQYMPNVVQEGDRFGQCSVMVWGGISIDGRTDVVVVCSNLTPAGYIEQILLQHVLVAANGVGPEFVHMHDNARPHVQRITRGVLREPDIQEMEWPAESPDLNPIEHVWDRLDDRSVCERPVTPQTLQDLEQALIEEWDLIAQLECKCSCIQISYKWLVERRKGQFHRGCRSKHTNMMKFALVFVAIVGLACGAVLPREPRDIHQDIQDFLAIIPTDDIIFIVLHHLANDPEFWNEIGYFGSDEFIQALTVIEGKQELKALLDDLESYDLRAYEFMNTINGVLGIPPIQPKHSRHTRGIKEVIDEIRAVLPKEEIKALYDEKMLNSPDFNKVITHLQSAEFKQIVDTFRSVPEEQVLERKLEEYGINVDEIINLVKDFLESFNVENDRVYASSTREASKKVPKIRRAHHPSSVMVWSGVSYSGTTQLHFCEEDVKTSARVYESTVLEPIVKNLSGTLFKNQPWTFQPDSAAAHKTTSTQGWLQRHVPDFISTEDLRSSMPDLNPLDYRLWSVLQEMAHHHWNFKAFLIVSSLPAFKVLKFTIDTFDVATEKDRFFKLEMLPIGSRSNQEPREAGTQIDSLRLSKHINMMKFTLTFVAIIGLACGSVIPREPRDIHQDIQDFLALLPVQDILNILFDHLANDAEFQDGVAYLQSDEFKQALTVVEGKQELKALLDDLEGYDLRAYEFMNTINGLVGIPPIQPKHSRHARSVKDLVEEIRAVLPKEEIKALYDEKMQNSPDFNKVITHLQSAEFKEHMSAHGTANTP